jgi:hypothetical protein
MTRGGRRRGELRDQQRRPPQRVCLPT